MSQTLVKKQKRKNRRKQKIRKLISGRADKLRVSVFRSNRYFYAQAIDDDEQKTILSIKSKPGVKIDGVKKLGEDFGKNLKKKKIKEVVFDRSGFAYKGKVAAFAEGLRMAEIQV